MIAATLNSAGLRSTLPPGRAAGQNERKREMNPVPDALVCSFFNMFGHTVFRYVSASIGLSFALGFLVFAWPAASQELPDTAAASKTDRIHLGDLVDVDFVGSFEYDWRGGLTSDGYLDGLERAERPVFALCRTEAEAAAAVVKQFAYFLRDPEVIVRIIDRSNRALAYVNGAVRVPQRFQLRRPASLLELIVLSGGITDSSAGKIVIFRPPNVSCGASGRLPAPERAVPRRIEVTIADLLGGKAEANPKVLSGDIVNVVEAPPIFVMGDVAAPRRMNLTPDLTLSRAIASAGGISNSFSGQKARIHRRGSDPKVLEIDLRRLMEKKIEDPQLEPYDVIQVEQEGVKAQKLAPIGESTGENKDLSKLPLRIVD